MKKIEKLSALATFISSEFAFLRYLKSIGEQNEIETDYCNIQYLKVLTSSFYLFLFKENIIQKNGDKLTTLLDETSLEKFVSILATKQSDNTWNINGVNFKDVCEIIHTLRNKLAHGDFIILNEQNCIEFEYENQLVTIDINKLAYFTSQLCTFWETIKRNGENVRTLVEEKLYKNKKIVSIKNEKTFLEALKDVYVIEVRNYPIFPKQRKLEDSQVVEELINFIVRATKNKLPYDGIINIYEKELKKRNIQLEVIKKSADTLPKDNIEDLKRVFELNKNQFKFLDKNSQINMIVHWVYEVVKGKVGKKNLSFACLSNFKMFQELENNNNLSPEEIIKKQGNSSNMANYYANQLIGNYILSFYTVYQFGLDNIYKNEERDFIIDILEKNKINFAKLDLSKFNPTINEIEHPSKDYFEQLEKAKQKCKTAAVNIESRQQSLEAYCTKNKDNMDNNVRKKLENMIDEARMQYFVAYEIYQKMNKFMIEDYALHVQNREIITHIRNSIAHGNIKINMFSSSYSGEDTMITFWDYYEGRLTFELTIKAHDFETLFSESNLEYLYDYVNSHYLKEKVLTK